MAVEAGPSPRCLGPSHGKAQLQGDDAVPGRAALHSPGAMRVFVGCASLALLGVRITGLTILCILDALRPALALRRHAVVQMESGFPSRLRRGIEGPHHIGRRGRGCGRRICPHGVFQSAEVGGGSKVAKVKDSPAIFDEYVRVDAWGSTGINPRGSRSLRRALVASARAPGRRPVRDRPGVTDGRRI
jgi:hypothetical protein